LFCFGGYPHVQDSIAQQFQAKILARGRAWVPAPPHGDFFLQDFLVQDHGRWYSQYPPGQAALLALGELADTPWLVCPLLAVLTGLWLYHTARRIYGGRTAGLVLLMFCLSPFVWFMSGERMNHTGTLFWISLGLLALAPALARRPRGLSFWRWG